MTIGMHSFHDTYKYIPPSRIASGGWPAMNIPANAYQGWGIWLLPYIEQDNLYKMYDLKAHWGDAKNRQVITTQIKVFYCPSTPIQPRVQPDFTITQGGTYTISKAASSDYAIVSKVDLALVTAFPADVDAYDALNQWGPFSYNTGSTYKIMRFATIRDGTSNTIAYCEDAGRPLAYRAFKRPSSGGTSTVIVGSSWADEASEFTFGGCIPPDSTRQQDGRQLHQQWRTLFMAQRRRERLPLRRLCALHQRGRHGPHLCATRHRQRGGDDSRLLDKAFSLALANAEQMSLPADVKAALGDGRGGADGFTKLVAG